MVSKTLRFAFALSALLVLLSAIIALPTQAATETKVTIIHFSDYHSHAVPFYSEGKPNQAGLARTIGYLKQAKATLPNLVVLSGGDTLNAGTPAWSDKYQCAEWPLFNGLLDAMAVGNHEFDYGWDAFLKCRESAQYPIIAANLVFSTTNQPVLKPVFTKDVGGIRVGAFALTGPDFPRLVSPKNLASDVTFGENIAAAKQAVKRLKDAGANVVVFFGHEDRESDFTLARQVPGIDLILGTHSHFKGEFQKIEGTNTYFISPFQYLTYLSQVELTFSDDKLTNATGRLVKMDENVKPDAETEAKVNQMQKDLEADPKYADKFVKIGEAAVELSNDNLDRGESVLGNFVMDVLRRTANANAAFSTASSFRASIPPGAIRMEDYLTALPYKNIIMVHELTGADVQALLDYSAGKFGSDNFSVTSGLRYQIVNGKVSNVEILKDPSNEGAGYEPLNPAKKYQVMTTDFQAKIAAGYKDIFARATNVKDTGLIVNDTLIDFIKKNSPVSARLEGRVKVAVPGAPTTLPQSGGELDASTWLMLFALGSALLGVSWLLRKKSER